MVHTAKRNEANAPAYAVSFGNGPEEFLMPRNSRCNRVEISGRRVGRVADAIAAHDLQLREIGNGLMRRVYISPDGTTVYKIPRRGGNASNESEHESMRRLRSHPVAGCHAVPTTLYYIDGHAVIAMPYLSQSSSDARYMQIRQFEARISGVYFIHDMHPGNYRVDGRGQIRITDLGAVSWGRNTASWGASMDGRVTDTDPDVCECTQCRYPESDTTPESPHAWCPICGNDTIWTPWTRCTGCRMAPDAVTVVSLSLSADVCDCHWCQDARAGRLTIA
jgi:hypothetical protein